jgi:hypothetical protein
MLREGLSALRQAMFVLEMNGWTEAEQWECMTLIRGIQSSLQQVRVNVEPLVRNPVVVRRVAESSDLGIRRSAESSEEPPAARRRPSVSEGKSEREEKSSNPSPSPFVRRRSASSRASSAPRSGLSSPGVSLAAIALSASSASISSSSSSSSVSSSSSSSSSMPSDDVDVMNFEYVAPVPRNASSSALSLSVPSVPSVSSSSDSVVNALVVSASGSDVVLSGSPDVCCVCHCENYPHRLARSDEQGRTRLHCNQHFFHMRCGATWFMEKMRGNARWTCPMCRVDLGRNASLAGRVVAYCRESMGLTERELNELLPIWESLNDMDELL